MADPKSYIGAVVQCIASAPATNDASGFGALSWSATLAKIVSMGAIGDETENINQPTLDGRNYHANGSLDGGEVPISFLYDPAGGSAAVAIFTANNNLNNTVSFKITDPDGKVTYFHGYIANFKDNERGPSSFKGFSLVVRVNSPTIRVSL